MATRRCSTCNINYPTDFTQFQLCKGCGTKTDHINESDPDDNWQELVDQYHGVYKSRELPGLDRARIVIHNDQAWVADVHLRNVGYFHAGIGTIIRVLGYSTEIFFEINGRARRLAGEATDTPNVDGWWIARVEPEDEFRGLPITDLHDAR